MRDQFKPKLPVNPGPSLAGSEKHKDNFKTYGLIARGNLKLRFIDPANKKEFALSPYTTQRELQMIKFLLSFALDSGQKILPVDAETMEVGSITASLPNIKKQFKQFGLEDLLVDA